MTALEIMSTGAWASEEYVAPVGTWWVNIQRGNPTPEVPHIALGPYETKGAAESALDESLLVQDECETDSVECWVADDGKPAEGYRLVLIDPNDPHHRGEVWYGACGVEFCADCLPRFNGNNEPIKEVSGE